MRLTAFLWGTVAVVCVAGCVLPQFSDYIRSVTLLSGDMYSAEVRVDHELDHDDPSMVVWMARAALPVAEEHCASNGKTARGAELPTNSSGAMVFRFACVGPDEGD